MSDPLGGVFGTLQLNGSLNDPICYVHLPTLPLAGTIMALEGPPAVYYRVLNSMLIINPITDLALAAVQEKSEATGKAHNFLSNQCVIFVEPFDPTPLTG